MENNRIPDSSQMLKEFPKRYPTNGTFELTVRCNLHCKMCLFRHDDSENAAIMAKELTAEQWIDMAKQVSDAGTVSLLITGGEPMLRPDFCEIWEGVYKQGFLISLYTNATLVTPKIMDTLRKYPPHRIGVTIYGARPEMYEKVCGDASAFERAIAGIEQLCTLPSVMAFRTTIIKDNYADVSAIEALVHERFGEDKNLVQARMVTKAVRGGCADVGSCRLEPEDNVRLVFRRGIDLIKSYVGDQYDERNVHLRLKKSCEQESDEKEILKLTLLGCDAGMNSYTISWDGKILGCQMLGLFETDALHDGFESAWEAFPFAVKMPELNETCKKCDKQRLCNCCIATRYAETLDPGGCPEYACRDTEIIHKMIDKEERANDE